MKDQKIWHTLIHKAKKNTKFVGEVECHVQLFSATYSPSALHLSPYQTNAVILHRKVHIVRVPSNYKYCSVICSALQVTTMLVFSHKNTFESGNMQSGKKKIFNNLFFNSVLSNLVGLVHYFFLFLCVSYKQNQNVIRTFHTYYIKIKKAELI